MMTDPIGDLLTRIRNGVRARHVKVDVPASRMKVAIVDLLKKGGFVKNYKLFQHEGKGVLRVYLKYLGKNRPVIHGLTRVSHVGRRVYARHDKIPKTVSGLGVAILSTSRGILTEEMARSQKVGGEIVCTVW